MTFDFHSESTDHLITEAVNPASLRIDTLSPFEIVQLMNEEDAKIPSAIAREAESIAGAITIITDRIGRGGRLIYIGAGTSGRLGVLDASECPPTFNTPPEMVVGLIAGGDSALRKSSEGVEDHPEIAAEDLLQVNLAAKDVLVGIATSGRTPYVIGAIEYARKVGAFTIGLSCNENSALSAVADLMITPLVGPEIIGGSTRLKAGTATKMVLNMLTTATMVQLGKTYGNLMVDLRATNTKLVARGCRLVRELTGVTLERAAEELETCDGEVRTAVVTICRKVDADTARSILNECGNQLYRALKTSADGKEVAVASSHAGLVIGVDAGGTKTTAWLGDLKPGSDKQPLGQGHAGPGNPRAVGFDVATQQIAAAIDNAFEDARLTVTPVAAVCLSVAGAGRSQEQEQLTAWAVSQNVADSVIVTNDAEPILAAASPDNVGIALICGTGSLAWGRNADGHIERVGGWGYMFGDEGSGYSIALAGLRAAARAADGRAEATRLLDGFMERLGVSTPAGFIDGIYGAALSREQIAAYADVVFEIAPNDVVARSILDHASAELAAMVTTLSRKLGWRSTDFVLGLAGGILMNQPGFRNELTAKVGISPDQAVNISCPAAGALTIAGMLVNQ